MTVRSLRRTLAGFRAGLRDPTTQLVAGRFAHATWTPDGPGTLLLRWTSDPSPIDACGLAADAYGPGAGWLLAQVASMTGADDPGLDMATAFPDASALVVRLVAANAVERVARSGNLYHALLPTIIAQRILASEALRQWAALVGALGDPAPGPPELIGDLRLPPSPGSLARRPGWWFHPLGIEAKRAATIVEVARHADRLWEWADAGPQRATTQLGLLHGVGAWTIGTVTGRALGDPDAVPVGDFHFPNVVAWNLAGEARADDARMLELLAPYAGQRGRVLRAIMAGGKPAPAFGPRRRTPDIRRL